MTLFAAHLFEGGVARDKRDSCQDGVWTAGEGSVVQHLFDDIDMNKRVVILVVAPVVVLAVLAAYLTAAWSWSYSSGERAGWVQKFSKKGWICKTWEGELALVSMPGAPLEKFTFTVVDDAVAESINRVVGRRVALHYEQKVGLPTSCFGDTRYYVTKVTVADDISLSPGVVIHPNQGVPPAPASSPSAPIDRP
ncbi:hypothetical protein [Aquabacterium fontiphilum]|uniref:hypothetical protein n=1 Tax=Aquabacterium fontiphilum TaxID=450365 RepID=UPI00191C247E|nr:hypothetical protein [Aquabacterium fontiphilum]